ncbi:MAG TPA: class F sortase [Mycobacteriales bacterium]|nr:class F sortase [Mycobacteriales bacterium]
MEPAGQRDTTAPTSLAADPASTSAAPAVSQPVRLRIPTIGVDAPVQPLGLRADGSLEVPTGRREVGWFTGAARPGERGPAVLAGHASLASGRAVFWRLRDVAPGVAIEVRGADGSAVRFRVTRVEQHPKDAFPTSAVYGATTGSELRLITCGGAVDPATRRYLDNVVLYAVRSP